MMGFAAIPGTAVLPMWCTAATMSPRASAMRPHSIPKRPDHLGSCGTTRMITASLLLLPNQ